MIRLKRRNCLTALFCAAVLSIASLSTHALALEGSEFSEFDYFDFQDPTPARTLNDVLDEIYGSDYLKPSPESLLGKYIAETGAKTVVRQFWKAPEGSVVPPHALGPKRLVVAVSEKTFAVFKKYFSSLNFLFLLNEHGNMAAFEGKRALSGDYWQGQYLSEPFTALSEGRIAVPMILDDSEGLRARRYFKLGATPSAVVRRNTHHGVLARYPWLLESATNAGNAYSASGAWSDGCGTWIGNMPIGNKLVNEYIFPSGDPDGKTPNRQKLEKYKDPTGYDAATIKLLRRVWTVPGHQQLGEILAPMSNRRGEFDNAGWASYTFLGAASTERVPVVFLFVKDVTRPLRGSFGFVTDDAY